MARRFGRETARPKVGRRFIGVWRALLHEGGQGARIRSFQEGLGAEIRRSEVSGTARADRCHDSYHCRRYCLWKAYVDNPKQSVGIRQVGRISKECHGIFDRRACQCRRSMLRLSQAHPRQSEEKGGRDPGKEQSQETKHSKKESKRKVQQQHQHQRRMQERRSHQPRELEGETLERESSILSGRM